MAKGKNTCKILKEIRRQIAEANDIEYVVEECQYKGDCPGTCPKCEAEVRYLEQQLHQRQLLGKAVMVAGVSMGLLTLGSCKDGADNQNKQQTDSNDSTAVVLYSKSYERTTGMVPAPESKHKDPEIIVEKSLNSKSFVATHEGEFKKDCVVKASQYCRFRSRIYVWDDEGWGHPSIDEKYMDVYERVDEMPLFPGGMDALARFFSEHLKYPENVNEEDILGKTVYNLIIDKDGSIIEVRVTQGVHFLWDAEVVRVISSMPKWIPGKLHGKVVKVDYKLPVVFRLSD